MNKENINILINDINTKLVYYEKLINNNDINFKYIIIIKDLNNLKNIILCLNNILFNNEILIYDELFYNKSDYDERERNE